MNNIWLLSTFFVSITLIVVISLVAFFRIKGTTSFFIAERNAPWYLIVGSLMASTISGAAFLGMQASFYVQGASVFWILIGCSAGLFAMCFFIGPKLRRYGKFTIPEYLADRFNSPLLKPVFSLLISFWMVILLGTLYVQGGILFESMFGLNYETAVIIIGLLTIIITIFGGMVAVLNSDFIGMFILIIAAVVAFPFILYAADGWGNVTSTIRTEDPEFFTNTSHIGITASISFFLIWSLGYLGHPGFLTRFYTAKNVREIIKAGIGISLLYLPFWIFIFIIAVSARIIYPEISDPETIWIVALYDLAPPIIAGMGLSGIFVGILTSVNTWLLTAATSLIKDIYVELIDKDAPDKKILNLSRVLLFLLGAIAIPIGIWRPASIIEMMNIAYAIAASAGGIVILMSMYYRNMTKEGAWAGMISGAIIAIFWRLGQFIDLLPTTIDPIIPTGIISLLLIVIVSKFTDPSNAALQMFDKLNDRNLNN